MLSDEDTRESEPLGMKQELIQMHTQFSAAASFVQPEILKLNESVLYGYFKSNPQLEIYRQTIDDIIRRKVHTLDENEEKLVAEAGLMADTAHESFNILSNADLPYPEITLSDGNKVRIDATNYSLYRANRNREDRIVVFDAFFDVLHSFKRTFGTQLYGELKKNLFYKNVRHYNSCLEASLDKNNIPVQVYRNLVDNINKNLSTLHRYLDLRKRMLRLDSLHFYDIYAPLVAEVDLEYDYTEAQRVIRESLEVLGEKYISVLDSAYAKNWIDVFPNEGKRSGAYMQGSAYDVHPYILMNYKNKYDDVSTLTHELGHAMHSYFSNLSQPYINSHYPIFLAEVASTVNEALLMHYMLEQIDDPPTRLSLLGNALEGFRGTLFRQTQFAEYELLIHEQVESGGSLTGDGFTQIYLDLFRKYYGHDSGVTTVADKFGAEWAYIPHFYYNFYVFQYSTSFTASQTIVSKMLAGEEDIVGKYMQFLASGCSEYAIQTLNKVGVDMTSDEPFNQTIKRMNEIMDEMDTLLSAM
jgi:oligoendopeptidase F